MKHTKIGRQLDIPFLLLPPVKSTTCIFAGRSNEPIHPISSTDHQPIQTKSSTEEEQRGSLSLVRSTMNRNSILMSAATEQSPPPPPQNKSLSREAILYMTLLAFQFGLQPILTRRFTPPTIIKSTVIFVQECTKFCIAFSMIQLSGKTQSAIQGTLLSAPV